MSGSKVLLRASEASLEQETEDKADGFKEGTVAYTVENPELWNCVAIRSKQDGSANAPAKKTIVGRDSVVAILGMYWELWAAASHESARKICSSIELQNQVGR